MHYNGPIVRPQTDAYSIFLEVTVGCTHNSCKFCNFYEGYPFHMAALEQIEEDLQEAAKYNPNAKKVWASGGNPYAMSVDRLTTIAKLIRKYLPKADISTYARVNDFEHKSVEEIRSLKELGYNDIVIGIESADDEVLKNMNKGYEVKDILEQLKKVEEAGVSYRVIYLGGLAGAGKCVESAGKTVEVLNQLHPYMMLLTTVAVLPGTELYQDMKDGIFEQPSEKERIEEFRTLMAGLKNEIYVFAETSTDMVGFQAEFPKDQKKIVDQLDQVIQNFTEQDEQRFHERRSRMTSV